MKKRKEIPINKKCPVCKETRPVEDFRWRKDENRYESYCKLCTSNYKRKWEKEHYSAEKSRLKQRECRKKNLELYRKFDRDANKSPKGYYRKLRHYASRLGVDLCDCCMRKLWAARNTL